jgi:hypothetical protein
LLPLHAAPGNQPPPLTAVRLPTEWTGDWWLALSVLVFTAVLMLVALFVQWFAHSQRQARREDRRLGRLEARARAQRAGHQPGESLHARPAPVIARGDDPPGTPRTRPAPVASAAQQPRQPGVEQ